MAKLQDKDIDASDISEYLANQDDFALELRTIQQANALGFSVRHGGTYSDPVTQKPRQYDIRGQLARSNRQVLLAIECKSLRKNFPLVVSQIPRATGENYHDAILAVPNRHPPLDIRRIKQSELYPSGLPVGKSIIQLGRSSSGNGWSASDSETHDKWAQAFASIQELLDGTVPRQSAAVKSLETSIAIPVLVVSNETLWTVEYNDSSAVSAGPALSDEVTLYAGRGYLVQGQRFSASHLHICTEIGLNRLLTRIALNDDWWGKAFQS